MTSLTAKQISDLDNSMVAAQNISMGTVIDALITSSGSVGATIKTGSFVPVTATTPVATGLTRIDGVVVSTAGSPTEYHLWTTATTGSVGGTIWVSCWSASAIATGAIRGVASTGSAAGHYALVAWMAKGA